MTCLFLIGGSSTVDSSIDRMEIQILKTLHLSMDTASFILLYCSLITKVYILGLCDPQTQNTYSCQGTTTGPSQVLPVDAAGTVTRVICKVGVHAV